LTPFKQRYESPWYRLGDAIVSVLIIVSGGGVFGVFFAGAILDAAGVSGFILHRLVILDVACAVVCAVAMLLLNNLVHWAHGKDDT
jgi:hypothetical protein